MVMKNKRELIVNIISLCVVFIVMAVVSMEHSGKILGYNISDFTDTEDVKKTADTIKINTTDICPDVMGYAGAVPVEITVVNDTVCEVIPLENDETPRFMKRVEDSGFFNNWSGLTVEEAMAKDVDAVTRATYTSNAVTENVRQGLATYSNQKLAEEYDDDDQNSIASIATLIVLILAMIIPLWWKNSKYRFVQKLLNAGVLGFWSATFINYTMIIQVMEMGIISGITTALLFIVAFIYPLFGKKGYYCAWVCPLGSMQELASMCNPKHKLKLSNKAVKALIAFRRLLWGALMVCLLTGAWMSWINYELFTAFAVSVAPIGVTISGAVFILLSVFVPRPYCRFVCPTGTLLKISQDIRKQ